MHYYNNITDDILAIVDTGLILRRSVTKLIIIVSREFCGFPLLCSGAMNVLVSLINCYNQAMCDLNNN